MTDRDAVLDIIALEVSKYENPDSQPWRAFTPTALAILTALQGHGFVVVRQTKADAIFANMLAASPGSGKIYDGPLKAAHARWKADQEKD